MRRIFRHSWPDKMNNIRAKRRRRAKFLACLRNKSFGEAIVVEMHEVAQRKGFLRRLVEMVK